MQQHPVPQNVTQYQFRLVGDMTLKQFLELLGGLLVAYLFFSSNLIFFIKWPLAISSVLFGFGLAFFPIEDRPLDQWIINFLRSIYAPTRYIWKKSNKVPSVFTFEPHPVVDNATVTKTVKAPTLSDREPKPVSDVSDEERQRINVLDAMLATAAPLTPAPQSSIVNRQSSIVKPSIVVRKLKPLSQVSTIFESTPRPAPLIKPQTISLQGDLKVPTAAPTTIPTTNPAGPAKQDDSRATNLIFSKPSISPSSISHQPSAIATPTNIRLPAAPSSPNLVVGMVVDQDSKIVENAIVQIVTGDGIPARAIKTNSLGQFYTSTPLGRGTYTIEADKDGLTFPPNQLLVEDKIISPLLIRAS